MSDGPRISGLNPQNSTGVDAPDAKANAPAYHNGHIVQQVDAKPVSAPDHNQNHKANKPLHQFQVQMQQNNGPQLKQARKKLYSDLKFTREEIRKLIKYDIEPYAVAFAKNSGLVIDDKAASFFAKGFTPLEVLALQNIKPDLSQEEDVDFSKKALALKKTGLVINEQVWSFINDKFSARETALLQENHVSLADAQYYRKEGLPITADTVPYMAHGFSEQRLTPAEIKLVMAQKPPLSPQEATDYRRTGVAILPTTMPVRVTGNLDKLQQLGKGAFNKVYDATVAKQGQPERPVAFKPMPLLSQHNTGWVSDKSGIDVNDPKFAQRNLATYEIDKSLGFNVAPQTEIGISQAGRHNEYKGLGLIMDKAQGKMGKDLSSDELAHPLVRRELTKLQILDAIVGQGDRHGGNYFVHIIPSNDGNPLNDTVTVTGIDNDQCLGQKIDNPDQLVYAKDNAHKGFRGVRMPKIIDTDMSKAINDLKPDDLAKILDDHGLSQAEVTAAQNRLSALQKHIADNTKTTVIDPKDWNSKTVDDNLDKDSSYAARDFEQRVAFQQQLNDKLADVGSSS